jgi:hypothetical protein
MSDLAGVMAAAAEVEAFCQNQGWRFCFIGGIAVQRWGMPRFTQDVDLTLLTGFGSEQAFVDPLLKQFSGRIRDARQFALDHRVLLARTAGGVDLDFALGALPFEEGSVSRASLWRVSEASAKLRGTRRRGKAAERWAARRTLGRRDFEHRSLEFQIKGPGFRCP